jgi:hypothetical protein
MAFTAEWYKRFYDGAGRDGLLEVVHHQMSTYADLARQRGMAWA